jgi:uncharacterized membrane protein
MPIALSLHILSAVIWVGGMFFAYMVLRPPAAKLLEPPLRLALWEQVFARFFFWVWAAVILLLASGYWMVFVPFGGLDRVGWHVHVMQVLGITMMAIFLHVFFAPYRRLRRALEAGDHQAGLAQLAQIRRLVGINLVLGLVVIVTATAGAYLLG